MNRAELLQAWSRQCDGVVSDEEASALLRGLEADAEGRRLVLADRAIDSLLRSRALDADDGRRFVAGVTTVLAAEADHQRFTDRVRARVGRIQRQRRTARHGSWVAVALAATLAGAAVAWWLLGMGGPDLPRLDGRRLAVGERIVATGPVELRWNDGTRAGLATGTVVGLGDPSSGKQLALESGRLEVDAAHQPEGRPMSIAGEHAMATVVGTSFVLDAQPGAMRLDVADGQVRLSAPDGSGILVAGGGAGLADRFGIRTPVDPLFAWTTTSAAQPVSGRRITASDGVSCLVGEPQPGNHVTAVAFQRTPAGLFGFTPGAAIACRVWLGSDVRWAGFYSHDFTSGRRGQWHLPLDRREQWCDLRFPLSSVSVAKGPLPQAGDTVHVLMLQAQPSSARLLLADLRILPAP